MKILKSNQRGYFDHSWLKTYHTFSFADYHNPEWMGFKTLRVINEDFVAPGQGFGTHGHRDMEIVTYVLSGELAHKDSMGHTEKLVPGEVQVMSAGSGVMHSEFNGSQDKDVHLVQIWIKPKEKGTQPRYAQRKYSTEQRSGKLCAVASSDGRDGSLQIGQDAVVSASILAAGQSVDHSILPGRATWLQVLKGELTVAGVELSAGDGVGIEAPGEMKIAARQDAELLLFDL